MTRTKRPVIPRASPGNENHHKCNFFVKHITSFWRGTFWCPNVKDTRRKFMNLFLSKLESSDSPDSKYRGKKDGRKPGASVCMSKRIGALALCIMTLITSIFSGIPATVAHAEEAKNSTEELATYFEANLNGRYASYSKMEPVDIIWVRQTLAERSKMPEKPTLDYLFKEAENADGFISMLDSAEYVYDVDDNSDYLVAMIDTMKDDANAYVAEAVFARNNLDGERLDQIIYDYNTGICYIPRDICKNEQGQQKIMEVQAQLLQLCDSAEPQTTVDVLVDNAQANVYGKVEVEADATDLNTTIVVAEGADAKNISADDITVHINGAEEGAANCIYSSNTGELTIPVSPSSLDSVEIEVKKDNFLAKMFAPMTVHAISESDLALAEGRIEVDGVPHEGVVMQDVVTAYYWTSDSMSTFVNKDRIYGISGANVSESVLQNMANNIATAAAGIDLTNLDQLGREYPWMVDLTGESFTDSDGTVYHFSEATGAYFPLKCAHITSPNTGSASVGTGGNDTANVVVHIYKVGADYMIVGLLTPTSHTQTGMGIFKIPMTPVGKGALLVKKVSSDTRITKGNSCYSVKGAKFGVYTDSGCTNHIKTLTTKSNGKTAKYEVDPGTYYVKETEAPKGYLLSNKVHKVVINDGETKTVTVTAENAPGTDPIGLMLTKEDSEKKTAQGGAKLSGAQFTVKYYDIYSDTDPADAGTSPTYTWVLKTDANGKCYLDEDHYVSGDELIRDDGTGAYVVPLGTITIQETKAPKGYQIKDTVYVLQTKLKNNGVSTSNKPIGDEAQKENIIRGGITVQKRDFETKEKKPMTSDASFKGITLEVVNKNDASVIVEDHEYAKDAVVKTITLDDNGAYTSKNNLLPYGTYLLREKDVPESTGYLKRGITERTFKIETNKAIVDLGKDSADTAVQDQIVRGGVKVQKRDIETKKGEPMTDSASFKDITMEIVNKNTTSVIVEGQEYAPDAVVKTFKTDDNGHFESANDLLPYGTYLLRETDVPKETGYLKKGILEQNFVIRNDGELVDLGVEQAETAIQDQIVRGGVKVQKRDLETKGTQPMTGLATFEGITMEIVNKNTTTILVEGQEYAADAVVKTFTTDEKGYYESAKDLLPYGKYLLRETEVPASTGYLKKGVTEQNFRITEDGVLVDLGVEDETTAIEDQIMRGDFEIRKIDADSQKKMSNIPFKVTSLTTGESHTFMTDDNGEYRSETAWIPHSQNTNKGTNGRKAVGDGLWFGLMPDGTQVAVNDELRALPYDDYEIEELPCDANDGKILYKDTFTVYSDNQVVYLNNIENKDVTPVIGTTATDINTKEHIACNTGTISIVDVVAYKNLTKGKEYVISGKLMDKKELEVVTDADGKEVTAIQKFTATDSEGEVEVTFTFTPTKDFGGHDVVVFEDLLRDDKVIAAHADIMDAGQTVRIPKLGTTATVDGKHEAEATGTVKIIDKIEYSRLIVGKEYTVKGVLMNKETGKELLIDGKNITAETTFTAEQADGSVELIYEVDAGTLKEKTVVVFEDLYYNGIKLISHADIEDDEQTVEFKSLPPEIRTTATDINTKDHLASNDGTISIVDVVEYKNLIRGKKYTVNGKLMDKSTKKPVKDADGKEVIASKTFTPKDTEGKVKVTFKFQAGEGFGGTDIVVFEDLLIGKEVVATHSDIEDEGQTVHVPGVKTTATAGGKKEAEATGTVTIVDRIAYTHLLVGKEYTVKGVLMNKETGKELQIDGKKVTAEKKFNAAKADGYVDLSFTVDASALKKKSVVVFENLYYGDILLAVHNDIGDEDQTVTFTEPPTTTPPSKTPPTNTPKSPKTEDEAGDMSGFLGAITKWHDC